MNMSTLEALSEDPVLLRAAEWFERLQHEDLDIEEVAAWQRWMGEKSEHREAFEDIQKTWERFDQMSTPSASRDKEIARDAYLGDVPVAKWRASRHGISPRIYAAAATVLIALAGMVGWKVIDGIRSAEMIVFETRAAEHRDARLPDGSELSLGAQSLVWIDFSAEKRAVVLDRGEAFFTVARDRQRPFEVRAGDSTITAIGTAFNVRRYGERMVVAVSEGAVKVGEKGKQGTGVRIGAGEQLIVEVSAAPAQVSKSDPDTIAAWRTGRLQYLGEPLKYVVADVNRYSAGQIAIGDAAVGDLLVTGTVFENDVDGWLKSLEEILPVTVERGSSARIVLSGRRE